MIYIFVYNIKVDDIDLYYFFNKFVRNIFNCKPQILKDE